MRNILHFIRFEALKRCISCQKNKHTFHAICVHTHTLQHMRQKILHRLVYEHHTKLEHTPSSNTPPHARKMHTFFMLYSAYQARFWLFCGIWNIFSIAVYMRNIYQIVSFQALEHYISCQKINTHFVPSTCTTHTLQHMRQNFLHRLVHEHHTELKHTTACSENAHIFNAL